MIAKAEILQASISVSCNEQDIWKATQEEPLDASVAPTPTQEISSHDANSDRVSAISNAAEEAASQGPSAAASGYDATAQVGKATKVAANGQSSTSQKLLQQTAEALR